MSNHFYILLELPPMPVGGLSDSELLQQLGFLYSEMAVNAVAEELRVVRSTGTAEENEIAAALFHVMTE